MIASWQWCCNRETCCLCVALILRPGGGCSRIAGVSAGNRGEPRAPRPRRGQRPAPRPRCDVLPRARTALRGEGEPPPLPKGGKKLSEPGPSAVSVFAGFWGAGGEMFKRPPRPAAERVFTAHRAEHRLLRAGGTGISRSIQLPVPGGGSPRFAQSPRLSGASAARGGGGGAETPTPLPGSGWGQTHVRQWACLQQHDIT